MSTEHCALSRLVVARSVYKIAEEACAHWDYEGEGSGHKCCDALADAEYELQLARKAVRKEQGK